MHRTYISLGFVWIACAGAQVVAGNPILGLSHIAIAMMYLVFAFTIGRRKV